jgi:F-type H+-transporting ATPase subunit a
VQINPMEQFRVEPIVPLHIAGYDVSFTNQALVMCVLVAAITLFVTFAMSQRRLVPGRMQSMAELSYEFVANMIDSTAGKAGYKFFPFVMAIFMFVLFSNYLGLIPGVFTITSQIAVNFALAVLVIVAVVITGFIKHGLRFFMLFVPKAPWVLLPLLVPIEVISFLTRPVSLSVRLFANMLAGHTMLNVFGGFVIALGAAGGVLSVISVAPMFMIIAVMALEFLVAFLQAYVFAMLTCIYLNEALHLHDHH